MIERFVDVVRTDRSHIYNEFSLQHELGIFIRTQFPEYLVRFERNVSSLFDGSRPFEKREIDIAIFSPDGKDRKYAIELKYPRNGQHPEQMFSFCKDIKFAEELRDAGFSSTAVVIFAEDRLFYEGSPAGIYGLFRAGHPIHGRIQKPTGARDAYVDIEGSYIARWHNVIDDLMFCVVEIEPS